MLNLSTATYREVEDALYVHEAPYYRYWAGGATFTETAAWRQRRKELYIASQRLYAPIARCNLARHGVQRLGSAIEQAAVVLAGYNPKLWAVSDGR
jgi:hypothetical protein